MTTQFKRRPLKNLPFQVQSWRFGAWAVVSCHANKERAEKGLAQIMKCMKGNPELFRIVEEHEPEWLSAA